MKNKITFLYGLGERKEYKNLFKYFNIPKIDWNKGIITPPIKKIENLMGFSMGAILACDYALKHKVKTLILCSITPGIETLSKIKADQIIFIVGEKEKWAYKNNLRLAKTLKCKKTIIVVPGADHRITGNYKKKLLEIVNNLE